MSDRVLLVEGPDDKHVVLHIAGQDPGFEILDKGGIDNLVDDLRFELSERERLVVGIIADANNHLLQRWQQLRDRLKSAGIELPPNSEPNGTIVQGRPDGVSRQPRVGVWLMPNNNIPGELEDFVQSMIPEDDRVWPLSEDYIERIPPADRKFGDKVTRAKVHAWLATREDPRLMGAGDLQTDGELAQRFVGWLRRLFE